MKFSDLGISRDLLSGLSAAGYNETFPIQEKVIPTALAGKDVIGKAQSGSGKTLAFIIPILEKVAREKALQALVLAPTRELALQIHEEAVRLGKSKGLKATAIYGGKSMEPQVRALREGVQIVIATPGRLIDHFKRRTIDLHHIRILVLDEADRMLDMGFIDDINYILRQIPHERQTMLFSATLPEDIRRIVHRYMRDPQTFELNRERPAVETVEQRAYIVDPHNKIDCLIDIIEKERPKSAIIFCATKIKAHRLASDLREYRAAAIHGDLSQAQRERVLGDFRTGRVPYLIATDVAARGIDIEGISHIINLDLPNDAETYIHRIGRTGRAGASGIAITLVAPGEALEIVRFEHLLKRKIVKKRYIDGELVDVSPDEFASHRAIITRPGWRQEKFQRGGRPRHGGRRFPRRGGFQRRRRFR